MSSRLLPVLLFIHLFTGCKGKDEKNFLAERVVGDYKFKINRIPSEESDLQQYVLKISRADEQIDLLNNKDLTDKELQQLLYYFSYTFQKDIYLETENGLNPCVLYHFERSYDLKGSRNFILGFTEPNDNEPKKIVIDSPVFNSGPVKIRI